MKIIFSRKGFDGAAGGCPSPIVDGRPVSLPIPTRMPSLTRYVDLHGPYASLVADLTNGRLSGNDRCHVDPDIVADILPRQTGWRGALGQVAASLSHLTNSQVGPGDLFLFWGLFRSVRRVDGRWRFAGDREHRIWGWLQVGEIIDLGADGSHALTGRPWLSAHPHVRSGWGKLNALYIASDRLEIGGTVLAETGSGRLSSGHRLSAGVAGPSIWHVPSWLHLAQGGCGMTYHPVNRWLDDGMVKSAARGQEFVATPSDTAAAADWVARLVQETA